MGFCRRHQGLYIRFLQQRIFYFKSMRQCIFPSVFCDFSTLRFSKILFYKSNLKPGRHFKFNYFFCYAKYTIKKVAREILVITCILPFPVELAIFCLSIKRRRITGHSAHQKIFVICYGSVIQSFFSGECIFLLRFIIPVKRIQLDKFIMIFITLTSEF